jgi:hypothetical protein
MNSRKSAYSTVFQINMALLGASCFSAASWAFWPDSLQWWGMGVFSIMCGMAAPAMLIRAIILMFKLYLRDKELADFEAEIPMPEPAKFAGDDAMRKAGMKK